MDALWLLVVVLGWLAFLKRGLPHFKGSGCGCGRCGVPSAEPPSASAPVTPPQRTGGSPAAAPPARS